MELKTAFQESVKSINFNVVPIRKDECVWCEKKIHPTVEFGHMVRCMNKFIGEEYRKNKNK